MRVTCSSHPIFLALQRLLSSVLRAADFPRLLFISSTSYLACVKTMKRSARHPHTQRQLLPVIHLPLRKEVTAAVGPFPQIRRGDKRWPAYHLRSCGPYPSLFCSSADVSTSLLSTRPAAVVSRLLKEFKWFLVRFRVPV
jgi:hypothetical protein